MKNRSISQDFLRGVDLYLDVCLFNSTTDLISALKREKRSIWATTLSPTAVEIDEPDVSTTWEGDYDPTGTIESSIDEIHTDSSPAPSLSSNTTPIAPLTHLAFSTLNVEVPELVAVVMGREADGVSDEILAVADRQVYIPMVGFSESFNVSVATGLVLNRVMAMYPSARGQLSVGRAEILRKKWLDLRSTIDARQSEFWKNRSPSGASDSPSPKRLKSSEEEQKEEQKVEQEEGSAVNKSKSPLNTFALSGIVSALQKGFQSEHSQRILNVYPFQSDENSQLKVTHISQLGMSEGICEEDDKNVVCYMSGAPQIHFKPLPKSLNHSNAGDRNLSCNNSQGQGVDKNQSQSSNTGLKKVPCEYASELKTSKLMHDLTEFSSYAWQGESALQQLCRFYPETIQKQWTQILVLRSMPETELAQLQQTYDQFFRGSLKYIQEQYERIDGDSTNNNSTPCIGRAPCEYFYSSPQKVGLWSRSIPISKLKIIFQRVGEAQLSMLWLIALLTTKNVSSGAGSALDSGILGTIVSKGCFNKYNQLIQAYRQSRMQLPESESENLSMSEQPESSSSQQCDKTAPLPGTPASSPKPELSHKPTSLSKSQLSSRRLMSEIDSCYGDQAFALPDLTIPLLTIPNGILPLEKVYCASVPSDSTLRFLIHRFRIKSVPATCNQALLSWMDGIPGFSLSFGTSSDPISPSVDVSVQDKSAIVEGLINSLTNCFQFLSQIPDTEDENSDGTSSCHDDTSSIAFSIPPPHQDGFGSPMTSLDSLIRQQRRRIRMAISPKLLADLHGAQGSWNPGLSPEITSNQGITGEEESSKSATTSNDGSTGLLGEDPHRTSISLIMHDLSMANKFIRYRAVFLSQLSFARMVRSMMLCLFPTLLVKKDPSTELVSDLPNYILGSDGIRRHPLHHALRQAYPDNTWVTQSTAPSFELAMPHYKAMGLTHVHAKTDDMTINDLVATASESEYTRLALLRRFFTPSDGQTVVGVEGLFSRQLETFSLDVATVFCHYMKIIKTSFVGSSMRLFGMAHSETLEAHPGAYYAFTTGLDFFLGTAFAGLPSDSPPLEYPSVCKDKAHDEAMAVGVDDSFLYMISRYARIRRNHSDTGLPPATLIKTSDATSSTTMKCDRDDESWYPKGGYLSEAELDYYRAKEMTKNNDARKEELEQISAEKVVSGLSSSDSTSNQTNNPLSASFIAAGSHLLTHGQSMFTATAALEKMQLEEEQRANLLKDFDALNYVVWPGDLRRQRMYIPSVGVDTSTKKK